jgi:hypothetical protein
MYSLHASQHLRLPKQVKQEYPRQQQGQAALFRVWTQAARRMKLKQQHRCQQLMAAQQQGL